MRWWQRVPPVLVTVSVACCLITAAAFAAVTGGFIDADTFLAVAAVCLAFVTVGLLVSAVGLAASAADLLRAVRRDRRDRR